ncbi:transcriptional repressor LexA [Collinsella tanakaei]|uniref:transcriptional repressor LexA n=1 Tax=Collinsella tanakaei TaxID=626935 RepID=UPI0025A35D27|nr:transcriptional repressor LexA [Collinsella tanakaei]MDM8299808.1 transcriptional repressor LexA [Collinsella tanakaei]
MFGRRRQAVARKITKRQQQIYDFIRTYQQEKGYPPSVREMAAAVGLSSPSTVHAHLSALEDHGLIKRDKTKPRALEVFNEDGTSAKPSQEVTEPVDRGTVSLPLIGRVAAGMPILAEQNIEDTFTLPSEIATDSSSFVLEVHGNSMINVGIYNGDYIIVREQKSAMNGEIVVAMIDGEATVKTFYKEQGRVRLQPENDAMEPIFATNPTILGKVVALMRRF